MATDVPVTFWVYAASADLLLAAAQTKRNALLPGGWTSSGLRMVGDAQPIPAQKAKAGDPDPVVVEWQVQARATFTSP